MSNVILLPNSGASITLQDILIDMGKRIDGGGAAGFVTGTATSGSTTGQLEDTVKLKSSIAQDDLHRDAWLWRPGAVNSGDVLTVIKDSTPSSGLIVPDRTWANPPYAAGVGETYAIFHQMDPDTLKDCVNRALQRMYFETLVTFTPGVDPDQAANNGALLRRYDITTLFPWLTENWQVRRVSYLAPGQSNFNYMPSLLRGKAYREDNVLYLWLPAGFNGNGEFYLRAVRSFYTYINSADSTTGLVNPGDKVDCELPWVVAGAMTEVYDMLGQQLDDEALKKYQATQAKWAGKFGYYSRQYFHMPKNEFRSSPYVGDDAITAGTDDDSGLSERAG